MKKYFIATFISMFIIVFLFMIFSYFFYFKYQETYSKYLDIYNPEVLHIEVIKDDVSNAFDINIDGIFYYLDEYYEQFNMPSIKSYCIECPRIDCVECSIFDSYTAKYRKYGFYYGRVHLVDNYALKHNMTLKNKQLKLYYFHSNFKCHNDDINCHKFIDDVIKNNGISAIMYSKKDILGGKIYVSKPFIVKVNENQIKILKNISFL